MIAPSFSQSYRRWPSGKKLIVNPANTSQSKMIPGNVCSVRKLQPAFIAGSNNCIASIEDVRKRICRELSSLDPSIRRMSNPHTYPAGISEDLDSRIRNMIIANRPK